MDLRDYLGTFAAQLVDELKPILAVKGVTSNTDLLGRYTEAAIQSLVNRIVQPMRVCSGAVLDHPVPNTLRQIDLIIWAPLPLPAIFQVEGFGLVPKSSAFGVIEVKRSNYNGVEDKLESFLADVEARKIVAEPAGPMRDYQFRPGIGIVCIIEGSPSSRLATLIEEDKVVAIFERQGETTKVRPRDVIVLVNFLHAVTWRYRVQSSGPGFPQIGTEAFEDPSSMSLASGETMKEAKPTGGVL